MGDLRDSDKDFPRLDTEYLSSRRDSAPPLTWKLWLCQEAAAE